MPLDDDITRVLQQCFAEVARISIGSKMPARSLELRHTIKFIKVHNSDINEEGFEIKHIMDGINSPILSIPGICYLMGAMIIAEIGDFSKFNSLDKTLTYAGLSPLTCQSGQLKSSHSRMEKRGSKYLRYAQFNTAKYECR